MTTPSLYKSKPASVMRDMTKDVRDHATAMQRVQDQYFAALKRAEQQYFEGVRKITDAITAEASEAAAQTQEMTAPQPANGGEEPSPATP